MKTAKIPPTIPSLNWEPKTHKTLQAAALDLFKKATTGDSQKLQENAKILGEETQASLHQLKTLEERPTLSKEIEALSNNSLLTSYLSLWIETPAVKEAAEQLEEANLEANLLHSLRKDLVLIEIYRRDLITETAAA